ncbi:hypothetical protein AVEN_233136-1 [Araneus ventricosus]|uniref:Integrase catalytic domain-containing protein n=1 Tax=Araneus ventricosus TaxID=182803 RepID=A0A4Y2U2P0_ARAVE|nr:hypothetical protein AVEN_233136-1 [Araneus ventricosus]
MTSQNQTCCKLTCYLGTPSASLPENRIKDVAVFEIIGFDLAGPLYLKGGSKAWICIYTCAVFRAVHLELLSSLTTEAFLQSFRRFIARRGRPSIVYCDNGSNFIGASNYLKSVNWTEIAQFSSIRRIQWLFNPPTASWWGGFWERLVGVMKQILRRVLGKAFLSYEEMITVLCDTESVINSRPLNQVDEVVLNKRIKYRQQLITDIRKRFRSEYLGLLIQRNEHKHGREIKLGEVVLIGSDNVKCTVWPLGFVIELLPGKDGVTRLVRLRTSKGELLRPVQRIFPLEVSSSWFKDCRKETTHENANNEVSSESFRNDTAPVTLKTKSGRTVKKTLKLDL